MMRGSLAERLRVLRAQRGLSLTEAAGRAGIQRQTLAFLERGERRPHTPTLAKIAAAYGVPVEELLELEEPALAGKAEAPPSPEQLRLNDVLLEEERRSELSLEDMPETLAELLERRGTATRHLADAHLSDAMDDASLDDARRIAREVRDEYTIVLEELGRLEERFPQAVTKIAGLLSRAVQQFMIARFSLYAKAGARFVPVNEVQVDRVDNDRVRILPSEADEARSEDLREAQARELEDFQKALQQGQEKLAQLAGAHA
jgi:transcriptional regulator with XRE-family HTH domain